MRSEGIINYPVPNTKRKLRRFICIINYDRMFIPNSSIILKPLYDLASKEKFLWNDEYTKIFTKIKNYLLKILKFIMQEDN